MPNPVTHLVQAFYNLFVRSSKARRVVKSEEEEEVLDCFHNFGPVALRSKPSSRWNLRLDLNSVRPWKQQLTLPVGSTNIDLIQTWYAPGSNNSLYQLDKPTLGICFLYSSSGLGISSIEAGQYSNSASLKFSCEICVEEKPVDDLFEVQGCTHYYCTDCITQYIISKLDQNITWVKCPVENCEGFLGTEHCRSMLPNDIYERWGKALCDSFISGEEKLYCPFKDCLAILIKEGDEVVRELACPYCLRLFCAQCESPWHAEMECEEFQRMDKDEREREGIMLMKLARKEKWQRCPSCKFYVQKTHGCRFIRCRCGVEFCYSCGKQATISHYCRFCYH